MTTAVSTLAPMVQSRVSAPAPLVLLELRRGLREYARDTEAWVEKVVVTTAPDTATYTLNPGSSLRVHRVQKLLDSARKDAPYTWTVEDATLRLDPTPSAATAYTAHVVVLPTLDCTSAPDDFLDDGAEAIAHAALAHIYSLPSQWRDDRAAQECLRIYQREVGRRLGRRHDEGSPRGSQARVKPPEVW